MRLPRMFVALQLRAIRRGVAKVDAVGEGSRTGGATKCLDSMGVDQGIHNMLLHNGTFDRYVSFIKSIVYFCAFVACACTLSNYMFP